MDLWGVFGRDAELDRLREGVRQATSTGRPRVVVVSGEPGIGKSRVVEEAARRSDLSPVRRLTGFEPERMVPLAAASQLLRSLTQEPVPAAGRLRELLRSTDGTTTGLEAVRVFDAAAGVLVATAPVLLVVDDLQWLDEVSRALLHYAVRAAVADRAPLAVLVATRRSTASAQWVGAVRSVVGDGYDELELGPLDVEAGVALAKARSSTLTDAAARQVWSDAQGSPFWIALQAGDADGAGEPGGALRSLLRLLTLDASQYLAAVVVFGQPVDRGTLQEVLEWSPTRSEAALTELVRRGVVREADGLVAPVHDLLRETAVAQLSEHQRSHLHRQVAAHLRARAAGDSVLLLQALDHALAAGDDGGEIALEFATSPSRRVLGKQGIERLGAVADGARLDAAARVDLNRRLADLAEELGHAAEAAARLEWLSRMAPSRSERADAAVRAARHVAWLDDLERTQQLVLRARNLATDPWTLVAADALEANRLLFTGADRSRAQECRERAVGAARSLLAAHGGLDQLDPRQRVAYVDALDAERYARLVADDIPGLLEASEEYAEATAGMGATHLDGLAQPAWTLRFFNRWREVAAQQRAIYLEAERQVYPAVAASLAYELALTSYHLGDITEAARMHDEARRLHARVDDPQVETSDTWLVGLRPLIDVSALDWQAGLDGLVATAAGQPSSHSRLLNHLRAAVVAARFDPSGRRALVREQVEAANEHAHAAGCPRCLAEVQVVSVEALARVGEVDDAEARLQAWNAQHTAPNPRFAFYRDWATALLAGARSEARAGALLEEVADVTARAGMQLEQVWAWLDLAGVLASAEPARAAALLSDAGALAGTLGAASERALAEARRRRLGGRTQAAPGATRQPPSASGLSPRELEVARLAARGARNAEIAQSLFLSTKTVEQHLSRVFAKLRVRNRAELVARYAHLLG